MEPEQVAPQYSFHQVPSRHNVADLGATPTVYDPDEHRQIAEQAASDQERPVWPTRPTMVLQEHLGIARGILQEKRGLLDALELILSGTTAVLRG